MYKLIGADGKEYASECKGKLGGHKRLKIYGKLDCPSALRHIAKGEYVKHRVFFEDERTALAAGYRPCGICMKDHYNLWKQNKLLVHAQEVTPMYEAGVNLCRVELINGEVRNLPLAVLGEDLKEVESARFQIDGDYCIVNLLAASGQWGHTIVWDYVQDRVVHLTSTPFVQTSVLFKDQVVSIYLVSYWGHPADLWYSTAPLKLRSLSFEPKLKLLSVPFDNPDGKEVDFSICPKGTGLIFRAGNREEFVDFPKEAYNE